MEYMTPSCLPPHLHVHVVRVNPTLSVTAMSGAQGGVQAENQPSLWLSFWADSRERLTYLQQNTV